MSLLNLFRHTVDEPSPPHIPVGSSISSALAVLESSADQIFPLYGNERGYRAISKRWELIIYAEANEVDAVWYNDEDARSFLESKLLKIHRYLIRYSAMSDWELRMDNGLMRYWYNPRMGVAMVYGIHHDVIRFNRYKGE